MGEAPATLVAQKLTVLFSSLERDYVNPDSQTPYQGKPAGEHTETMDVAQGKLCMGFVTSVTNRSEDFAAMQVLNVTYGGGASETNTKIQLTPETIRVSGSEKLLEGLTELVVGSGKSHPRR